MSTQKPKIFSKNANPLLKDEGIEVKKDTLISSEQENQDKFQLPPIEGDENYSPKNQILQQQQIQIQQKPENEKSEQTLEVKYGDFIYLKVISQNQNQSCIIIGDGIVNQQIMYIQKHTESAKQPNIKIQQQNSIIADSFFISNNSQKRFLLDQNIKIVNKKCLFQIRTPNQYNNKAKYKQERAFIKNILLKNMQERILDENINKSYQKKLEDIEQALNEEQEENEQNFQNLRGQNINYEQEISLLHLYSNTYLKLTQQDVLNKNSCINGILVDQEEQDNNCNFKLQSVNITALKSYGQPAQYKDIVYMISSEEDIAGKFKVDIEYGQSNTNLPQDPFLYQMSGVNTNVNINNPQMQVLQKSKTQILQPQAAPVDQGSKIQIMAYKSNADILEQEGASILKAGDIIAIQNLEFGFLAARRNKCLGDMKEDKQLAGGQQDNVYQSFGRWMRFKNYLIKETELHFQKPKNLEEEIPISCYWEVQLESKLFTNKPIQYYDNLLLKHVQTGLFLCLNDVGQGMILTDSPEQKLESCKFQYFTSKKGSSSIKLTDIIKIQSQKGKLTLNHNKETGQTIMQIQKTNEDISKTQALYSVHQISDANLKQANFLCSLYNNLAEFYFYLYYYGFNKREVQLSSDKKANSKSPTSSITINSKSATFQEQQIKIFFNCISRVTEFLHCFGSSSAQGQENNPEAQLQELKKRQKILHQYGIIDLVIQILDQSHKCNFDFYIEEIFQLLSLFIHENQEESLWIMTYNKQVYVSCFLAWIQKMKLSKDQKEKDKHKSKTKSIQHFLKLASLQIQDNTDVALWNQLIHIWRSKIEEVTEENVELQTFYLTMLEQLVTNQHGITQSNFSSWMYMFFSQEKCIPIEFTTIADQPVIIIKYKSDFMARNPQFYEIYSNALKLQDQYFGQKCLQATQIPYKCIVIQVLFLTQTCEKDYFDLHPESQITQQFHQYIKYFFTVLNLFININQNASLFEDNPRMLHNQERFIQQCYTSVINQVSVQKEQFQELSISTQIINAFHSTLHFKLKDLHESHKVQYFLQEKYLKTPQLSRNISERDLFDIMQSAYGGNEENMCSPNQVNIQFQNRLNGNGENEVEQAQGPGISIDIKQLIQVFNFFFLKQMPTAFQIQNTKFQQHTLQDMDSHDEAMLFFISITRILNILGHYGYFTKASSQQLISLLEIFIVSYIHEQESSSSANKPNKDQQKKLAQMAVRQSKIINNLKIPSEKQINLNNLEKNDTSQDFKFSNVLDTNKLESEMDLDKNMYQDYSSNIIYKQLARCSKQNLKEKALKYILHLFESVIKFNILINLVDHDKSVYQFHQEIIARENQDNEEDKSKPSELKRLSSFKQEKGKGNNPVSGKYSDPPKLENPLIQSGEDQAQLQKCQRFLYSVIYGLNHQKYDKIRSQLIQTFTLSFSYIQHLEHKLNCPEIIITSILTIKLKKVYEIFLNINIQGLQWFNRLLLLRQFHSQDISFDQNFFDNEIHKAQPRQIALEQNLAENLTNLLQIMEQVHADQEKQDILQPMQMILRRFGMCSLATEIITFLTLSQSYFEPSESKFQIGELLTSLLILYVKKNSINIEQLRQHYKQFLTLLNLHKNERYDTLKLYKIVVRLFSRVKFKIEITPIIHDLIAQIHNIYEENLPARDQQAKMQRNIQYFKILRNLCLGQCNYLTRNQQVIMVGIRTHSIFEFMIAVERSKGKFDLSQYSTYVRHLEKFYLLICTCVHNYNFGISFIKTYYSQPKLLEYLRENSGINQQLKKALILMVYELYLNQLNFTTDNTNLGQDMYTKNQDEIQEINNFFNELKVQLDIINRNIFGQVVDEQGQAGEKERPMESNIIINKNNAILKGNNPNPKSLLNDQEYADQQREGWYCFYFKGVLQIFVNCAMLLLQFYNEKELVKNFITDSKEPILKTLSLMLEYIESKLRRPGNEDNVKVKGQLKKLNKFNQMIDELINENNVDLYDYISLFLFRYNIKEDQFFIKLKKKIRHYKSFTRGIMDILNKEFPFISKDTLQKQLQDLKYLTILNNDVELHKSDLQHSIDDYHEIRMSKKQINKVFKDLRINQLKQMNQFHHSNAKNQNQIRQHESKVIKHIKAVFDNIHILKEIGILPENEDPFAKLRANVGNEDYINKMMVIIKSNQQEVNTVKQHQIINAMVHYFSENLNSSKDNDPKSVFNKFITMNKSFFSANSVEMILIFKNYLLIERRKIEHEVMENDDYSEYIRYVRQGNLLSLRHEKDLIKNLTAYQGIAIEQKLHIIAFQLFTESYNYDKWLQSIEFIIEILITGDKNCQDQILQDLIKDPLLASKMLQQIKFFFGNFTRNQFENIYHKKEKKICSETSLKPFKQYLNLSEKILRMIKLFVENDHNDFKNLLLNSSTAAATKNPNILQELFNYLFFLIEENLIEDKSKADLINQTILTITMFCNGNEQSLFYIAKNKKVLLLIQDLMEKQNVTMIPMKIDKFDEDQLNVDNKKLIQRMKTFYIGMSFIKMMIVGNLKNQTLKDILKANMNLDSMKLQMIKIYLRVMDDSCQSEQFRVSNQYLITFGATILIIIDYMICIFPKDARIQQIQQEIDNLNTLGGNNTIFSKFLISRYSDVNMQQLNEDSEQKKIKIKKLIKHQHPSQQSNWNRSIFKQLQNIQNSATTATTQMLKFFLRIGENGAVSPFYRTIAYFQQQIGIVEIIDHNQVIHKIYFKKPFCSRFLTPQIQNHLINLPDRSSQVDLLQYLVDNVSFYQKQMMYQQWLSQYKIIYFLVNQWRKSRDMVLFLIFAINILNFFSYDSFNDEMVMFVVKIFNQIFSGLTFIFSIYFCLACLIERFPEIKQGVNLEIGLENKKTFKQMAGFREEHYLDYLQFKVYSFFSPKQMQRSYWKVIFLLIFDFQLMYCIMYCIINAYAFLKSGSYDNSSIIFYAILMLDIIRKSDALQNIIRSITKNWLNLILFAILGLIVLYLYGIIIFFQHNADWINEDGETENIVRSFLGTITLTIKDGLRKGEGISGSLKTNKWHKYGDNSEYWDRYGLDLSFFIIINILFINIIFGIIIDTFGELRDQFNEKKQQIVEKCFICGQQKTEIEDIIDGGWFQHIYLQHNVYHMLFFLIYCKEKEITDCDMIEKYVKNCMLSIKSKTDFFPINRCYEYDVPDANQKV